MTPMSDKQKYVKGEWELIEKEIQEIKKKINVNKLRGNVQDESDWFVLKSDLQTIWDLEMELHRKEPSGRLNPNPLGGAGCNIDVTKR